ncbi:MAG TPA: toll/interleukin-1 receptor domain-containing protein [Thermoanaerobaculia bacterium]|nr:toll/interleukin-1 receptor domain-containing protein [Thermoanaerobaculia bacterium]
MPGPKVFVSYSHKDKKALEQLQRFLRPLERDGLVTVWADTRQKGGDDWVKEIDQAMAEATVAVLLISQDFLNSKYIVEEEVPRVLEREAAGRLKILPVFLSPSLVGDVELADPRSGGRGKIVLTKFQGYGTADKPLSEREWSERERIYCDLARQIRTLSGAEPVSGFRAGAVAPSSIPFAAASPNPARAYELTVQLEERGDTLFVTYHLPGLEPFDSASLPWPGVKQRIDPIHQALDTANNRTLQPQLETWGEILFDLLFGAVESWEPILRAVFGRAAGTPRPNPIFGPVRLRIQAEEARLSGLPWRLTSWKGQPLVDAGWIFTTTHTGEAVEDRLTTAPSNVLVVAPQTPGNGGGPHDPGHAQAVCDVLKKAWPTGRDPGYVQIARTKAQLVEGLRGLRPHILYVYGSGRVAGGRPSLLLEGERGSEPLVLADLRPLFSAAGHAPAVVYLNTEGLTDAGGSTPDQILGDGVPLLIWRRRPEWSADSTTLALLWLHRWLGQGEDPAAAFHQVQRDAYPPSCEAQTLAIHSNYRAWRTSTYQASPQRHYPSLRLDRDHQKSLVRKHAEELVRSGSRRVMALVPYAATGNSIPLLSDQLRHDLELSLSHLAEIAWVRLELPETRANLRRDLEEELKLQLGAQPNEPVPYLLRRHAPKVVRPGRKPVLWLDWGAFGASPGLQPGLKDGHLEAWLRFSSEFLGTQCPDDLRIVSYAALEIPETASEEISSRLKAQRRQPWCRTPAFRLSELPPLGKVAEADLLDFLEDPANSSCDPGIQTEIAERLVTKTGGTFEETVALLQEAESGSWYDLLAQLRREQGLELTSL